MVKLDMHQTVSMPKKHKSRFLRSQVLYLSGMANQSISNSITGQLGKCMLAETQWCLLLPITIALIAISSYTKASQLSPTTNQVSRQLTLAHREQSVPD